MLLHDGVQILRNLAEARHRNYVTGKHVTDPLASVYLAESCGIENGAARYRPSHSVSAHVRAKQAAEITLIEFRDWLGFVGRAEGPVGDRVALIGSVEESLV